jgi:hypothetical protein
MVEATPTTGAYSQGILQGIERPVAFVQCLAYIGFSDTATKTYIHDRIPPNLDPPSMGA